MALKLTPEGACAAWDGGVPMPCRETSRARFSQKGQLMHLQSPWDPRAALDVALSSWECCAVCWGPGDDRLAQQVNKCVPSSSRLMQY